MESMDEYIKRLEKLSNEFGPPGEEERIRELVKKEASKYVDKIEEDKIGNLYLVKEGDKSKPKVLLAAHMDEVALIITHIHKNGYLRFMTLGGIDPRVLYAQRILIMGKNGPVKAYIGATPPHLLEKKKEEKSVSLSDLYIDIGVDSEEEVRELGVKIGSKAVFDTKFMKMGKNKVAGKAFDDRIGVSTIIEILKRLKDTNYNLIGLISVQEEVGLRGARAAAWMVEPDYAIILECTAAGDMPGVLEHKMSTIMGHGPAITIADMSMVANPKIVNMLVNVAEERELKFQFKKMLVGGTDAGAIHLAKGGILSGVVSVPGRYIHSPVAIADLRDIKGQIELVEGFIEKVNKT